MLSPCFPIAAVVLPSAPRCFLAVSLCGPLPVRWFVSCLCIMKRSKGHGSGANKRPAVSRVQPTAARAQAEQQAEEAAALYAAAYQQAYAPLFCKGLRDHEQAWFTTGGYVLFQSRTAPDVMAAVLPRSWALSDPVFLSQFTRVHNESNAPAPSPAAAQPPWQQQAAAVPPQQQAPTRHQQAQPQEQMHTASGQVSL